MQRMWIALALVAVGSAFGQEPAIPPPPSLEAGGYFLVDFSTQSVIAESSADERLPPASLTKLMTAYLVFEALESGRLDLDELVKVSEKAWRMRGSRMFIEVDTEVVVEDLVRGMIIQSGNDASVALAERIAGSEESFVELMNREAHTLGMTNTEFRNSTGLPARGHYSTARDLATLARAIIEKYPQFYSLYSEREFTYNDIWQRNRNRLLWRDESVDGLKTGYTSSAGYCLVSSAQKGDMRLIAVVLGMNSSRERTEGSQALLNYGFEYFETSKVFSRGETVGDVRVLKGDTEHVSLGVPDDVYVTAPRGQRDALTARAEIPESLVAPLLANQTIGMLNLSLNNETLLTIPLVALKEVRIGSAWTRILDEFEILFDSERL